MHTSHIGSLNEILFGGCAENATEPNRLELELTLKGFFTEQLSTQTTYLLIHGHSEYMLRDVIHTKISRVLRDSTRYQFILTTRDHNKVVDDESYEHIIANAQASGVLHLSVNRIGTESPLGSSAVAKMDQPAMNVLTSTNLARLGAPSHQVCPSRILISDLHDFVGRWSLTARVMSLHYEVKKPSGTSHISVELTDSSKHSITGVAFGADAIRLNAEFKLGRVFSISHGMIQAKNVRDTQIHPNDHPFYITFKHTTQVKEVPDDHRIPPLVSADQVAASQMRSFGGARLPNMPLVRMPAWTPALTGMTPFTHISATTSQVEVPHNVTIPVHRGSVAKRTILSRSTTSVNTSTEDKKRLRDASDVDQDSTYTLVRRHHLRIEQQAIEKTIQRHNVTLKRSNKCRFCAVDWKDEQSVEQWMVTYLKLSKKLGFEAKRYTNEEWQNLLEDKLDSIAQDVFYDLITEEPFYVHCTCALVAWKWQIGEDTLEQIALDAERTQCELCGELGATVVCYHPDCDRSFHSVCAFFSHDYVTWGAHPEWRLVPQCPRHKDMSRNRHVKEECVNEVKLHKRDHVAFDAKEEYVKDIKRLVPYQQN